MNRLQAHRRRRRRDYLREHPLAIALSFAAVLIAAVAVTIPLLTEGTALGQVLPPGLALAWYLCHGFGGLLALRGLFDLNPRLEAAGFSLLAATFGVVVFTTAHLRGVEGLISIAWLSAITAGCAARAASLMRDYPADER